MICSSLRRRKNACTIVIQKKKVCLLYVWKNSYKEVYFLHLSLIWFLFLFPSLSFSTVHNNTLKPQLVSCSYLNGNFSCFDTDKWVQMESNWRKHHTHNCQILLHGSVMKIPHLATKQEWHQMSSNIPRGGLEGAGREELNRDPWAW